jgi:hypothetical protein
MPTDPDVQVQIDAQQAQLSALTATLGTYADQRVNVEQR